MLISSYLFKTFYDKMKKAQKHFVNTFHKSEVLNSEGSTFSGFNHVSIGLSGDNYRVATLHPFLYMLVNY